MSTGEAGGDTSITGDLDKGPDNCNLNDVHPEEDEVASASNNQCLMMIHPLDIQLVLSKVINDRTLTFQDLKNIRLVNTTWNEEVTPNFKSQPIIVKLNAHEGVETSISTLSSYSNEMEHFGNDSFAFPAIPLGTTELLKDSLVNFAEKFGSGIKYLEMELVLATSLHMQTLNVFEKLPNLEVMKLKLILHCTMELLDMGVLRDVALSMKSLLKVRELMLDYEYEWSGVEDHPDLDLMQNFIIPTSIFIACLFPKIESLSLFQCEGFHSILQMYASSRVPSLQEINLKSDQTFGMIGGLFQPLVVWPIGLKKFSIDFMNEYLLFGEYQNFFSRHAPTLEDLSIKIYLFDAHDDSLVVPTFPKLRTFEIVDARSRPSGACDFQFPLGFSQHFPSLNMKKEEIEEIQEVFVRFRTPYLPAAADNDDDNVLVQAQNLP